MDRTIADGRDGFDCSGCPHRHDEDTITAMEVARCLVLIAFLLGHGRMDAGSIDIDALMRTARPWREFAPTLGMDRAEIV